MKSIHPVPNKSNSTRRQALGAILSLSAVPFLVARGEAKTEPAPAATSQPKPGHEPRCSCGRVMRGEIIQTCEVCRTYFIRLSA